MTLAHMVTEVNATEVPERSLRKVVWPWHELEYAVLEADSDRILADALTPQAVASGGTADRRRGRSGRSAHRLPAR
ncbi:hypothetical protein P3H15_51325 [Rhodococcus sp. T2V]|uniref:hypothetical protein n=1 Tax=Rhodococcus sp. T2V TaxID=3034164 RepID=UPI0023E1AA1D|nr:hypothetical protein [Rhodococcus sp. T2V]MDF3313313.1 hypothetical protein [Rhodococcus sp. T2V]